MIIYIIRDLRIFGYATVEFAFPNFTNLVSVRLYFIFLTASIFVGFVMCAIESGQRIAFVFKTSHTPVCIAALILEHNALIRCKK